MSSGSKTPTANSNPSADNPNSPGYLADVFYKNEMARESKSHKRRILFLVLAIIGFIVFFALLYSNWSALINSSATSYGLDIAITAQYPFLNGAVWGTGWDKTGEFFATLYYNSKFGGDTNPYYSPGSNSCGSSCSSSPAQTFDEWVGNKNDIAQAGQNCTPTTNCKTKMTLISLIKAMASDDMSIVDMFDVAYTWLIINNQFSKSKSSSGALNSFFAYGLPIINTAMMALTLLKP